MRRLAAALSVMALAATACGSTVQQTSGYTEGLSTTSGGSSNGTGTGAVSGTSGTSGGQQPQGTNGTSATGTTGAPAQGQGSAPGTSGPPAVGGPSVPGGRIPGHHKGVTPTTVKLGFLYLGSAGTVVGAFGVKGYSQGDELGEMKALVADQNAHGGLAGRKIELVPHDLGGIDASAYQSACTFFTQDSPVFMVLSSLGHADTLNACLAKGDVGYTSDYIAPSDRLMRGLGPIYAPDDIGAERYALLLGRSLVTSGLIKAGDKVGVIRKDDPDYARITKQVLRPLLEATGAKVVSEETYNATDASASVSDSGPMMFRMRSAGVTHIVSYESPLFYMTAADSQRWYPFWTVTSRAAGGGFLEGSAPASELKNSGGPGWMPVSDIATARLKGYVNAEERRCVTTLAKQGYSYTGAPRYVEEMLCGELYHVVRVLARAAEVSTRGFRIAAESLPSYPSPLTFSMSFAGGRHDGAAGYRILRYSTSCGCYGYTSPLRPIPTS
jgi:hypothetical protein